MTEVKKSEASEPFSDRRSAGAQLAAAVAESIDTEHVVVLALPRGGVPVAHEVASRIDAPLDILVVRKLGVPWQPEMAFGAIASGDVVVLNRDHMRALGLKQDVVDDIIDRERAELERRETLYREEREAIDLTGKTVIVVDDGIATGSTVRAALRSLDERGAGRRIVACPVAAEETVRALEEAADEVICLRTPSAFGAVGSWYDDFAPVFDSEVKKLLGEVAQEA